METELDPKPTTTAATAELPVLESWKPLTSEMPPVRGRELFAVMVLVVLSDLTIYRGEGYAGLAMLFAAAPVLMALGSCSEKRSRGAWLLAVMFCGLAAKALWCGSVLLACCGFFGIVAFAMTLVNRTPFVLSVLAFAGQTVSSGARGLNHFCESAHTNVRPLKHSSAMPVLMPLAAFGLFGSLFVLANPDLVSIFSHRIHNWLELVNELLSQFSFWEVPFCVAAAWFVVGLLRPEDAEPDEVDPSPRRDASVEAAAPAPLYSAYRNTLLTVIGLFVAYLGFEFQTLWFREFPKGFHYSGYAHEGAAWLTFALGLATIMLSLIFRGDVLRDERLPKLKKLAWIWSALNLLLAVAVYHRLCIYVGFNGMTRMRIVGFFGMTSVVAGFGLVLWKIARNRDFIWLFRRQLWVLAGAIYLFSLTPVDALWVRYNVNRILAGDPAPSVQLSVHPIDAEGMLSLHRSLLDCDDELIRDGVQAMMALTEQEAEAAHQAREKLTAWGQITSRQLADEKLLSGLRTNRERWSNYTDRSQCEAAWERFRLYAYQWY
jgi:hypothetical protein